MWQECHDSFVLLLETHILSLLASSNITGLSSVRSNKGLSSVLPDKSVLVVTQVQNSIDQVQTN